MWPDEERPEDFAVPVLGDVQAHTMFDRIQRCFLCGQQILTVSPGESPKSTAEYCKLLPIRL